MLVDTEDAVNKQDTVQVEENETQNIELESEPIHKEEEEENAEDEAEDQNEAEEIDEEMEENEEEEEEEELVEEEDVDSEEEDSRDDASVKSPSKNIYKEPEQTTARDTPRQQTRSSSSQPNDTRDEANTDSHQAVVEKHYKDDCAIGDAPECRKEHLEPLIALSANTATEDNRVADEVTTDFGLGLCFSRHATRQNANGLETAPDTKSSSPLNTLAPAESHGRKNASFSKSGALDGQRRSPPPVHESSHAGLSKPQQGYHDEFEIRSLEMIANGRKLKKKNVDSVAEEVAPTKNATMPASALLQRGHSVAPAVKDQTAPSIPHLQTDSNGSLGTSRFEPWSSQTVPAGWKSTSLQSSFKTGLSTGHRDDSSSSKASRIASVDKPSFFPSLNSPTVSPTAKHRFEQQQHQAASLQTHARLPSMARPSRFQDPRTVNLDGTEQEREEYEETEIVYRSSARDAQGDGVSRPIAHSNARDSVPMSIDPDTLTTVDASSPPSYFRSTSSTSNAQMPSKDSTKSSGEATGAHASAMHSNSDTKSSSTPATPLPADEKPSAKRKRDEKDEEFINNLDVKKRVAVERGRMMTRYKAHIKSGYLPPFPIDYTTSLEELNMVVTEGEEFVNRKNTIEMCQATMMMFVKGTEKAGELYNALTPSSWYKSKLTGWTSHVHGEVSNYDDVLEKVYQKYMKSTTETDPLMQLFLMLVSSAFMFHLGQIAAEYVKQQMKTGNLDVGGLLSKFVRGPSKDTSSAGVATSAGMSSSVGVAGNERGFLSGLFGGSGSGAIAPPPQAFQQQQPTPYTNNGTPFVNAAVAEGRRQPSALPAFQANLSSGSDVLRNLPRFETPSRGRSSSTSADNVPSNSKVHGIPISAVMSNPATSQGNRNTTTPSRSSRRNINTPAKRTIDFSELS